MVMLLGLGVWLAALETKNYDDDDGGTNLISVRATDGGSGSLDFEAITGEWRSHRKSIFLRISRILRRSVALKVHYSNLF